MRPEESDAAECRVLSLSRKEWSEGWPGHRRRWKLSQIAVRLLPREKKFEGLLSVGRAIEYRHYCLAAAYYTTVQSFTLTGVL